MLNFLRCLLIFALVTSFTWLLSAPPARADGCASLVSLGAPYNQNFDTLATSGTANATSTLPVGWNLTETGGGVRDNEQYGADDGSSNIGDTYSYGATGNNERAFGGLRSSVLVPVMGVCFTNNTGVAINSLKIVYVGEMWRLGTAGQIDQLDFEYSTNATSLTTGIWTAANALDFISPTTSGSVGARDGNTPANRTVPNATITGLSIANGANFWLRWTDLDASGSDDGLAIDNFSLIPLAATANLTATKTDVLITDADSDTQADPGDVLSYTVVISSGGATATGLTFSDTLDANTDLLGSASVSSVAFDNTYNASTNPASLNVPDGPTDLFADDYPGQNPAVAGISSFGGGSLPGDAGTNAAGGTVTLNTGGSLTVNANGSFNFTPPVGFQGVFGFFYRLQNSLGPSDGLVTITVDAPPTVTTTSPVNAATNVNGASNITVNFSENVAIAAGGITLDCGAGAVSFTPALPVSGVNIFTLDPTANLPGLATCTVTVLAANVTDSDANDPPNNLDGDANGIEGDNYSFSFQVAPTANDDSFAVTPHLTLASSGTTTGTVRANDDPTNVTITGFGGTLGTANGTTPNGTNSITTGLGGTVILNADGTFTFTPPPDQRSVSDAFFYTITGGDTATVTLAIQNQSLIWFVDATAVAGGNGTQARPFNLLTGAGSFDAVASDNTGDFIFIADGSYTCGLTLLNNQTVVGDGASSTLQAISGVTPVSGSSLPAFSGTDPTLSNAAGDCLTLGSGNTLRGLTIGDTSATGSDITGTNFGTLTVTETTLNGTGRALNLNNGTFNATLDGLTSTSGTNNVNLVSVSGTANLGSGALSGASSDAFVINGGNVSATYNGNISQASNAALVSVSGGHSSGTLTFQTGTLNTTSGTGLQFNNADGVYNFNGPTTLNGGDAGVDITNGSGGTFSFSTNTSINNPAGIAYREDTSTASVTYNGTITKNNNANNAVDINAKTGGTTAFNGAIVASTTTANAIDLTNSGGTVNFTGGLNLTTTSGVGFNATGAGATVSATQNNSTIVNTINSTGGTALNVVNTAIGASGLTFRSISTNGATNGIVLNNTGTTAGTHGGLTVTGTGTTDGSGGTIQNTTNRGASFITARDVTLRNMNFTNAGTSDLDANNAGLSTGDNLDTNAAIHLVTVTNATLDNLNISGGAEQGINGNTVANFTLSNSSIVDVGNEADEDGIHFFNMSGTSAITNTTINCTVVTPNTTGGDDHLNLQTTSGTLNLTISGGSATNANKGSGYLFGIRGTTNATITFNNASSQNNFSGGIVADVFDTATMNLQVTNSTSSGNNDQLSVSAGDNSNVDLNANNNTLSSVTPGAGGDFVVVSLLGSAFDNGFVFDARIQNNIITTANNVTADGLIAFNAGGGTMNMLISGNTFDYGGSQQALNIQGGQDGGGTTNATVTGNNIDVKIDGTLNAVRAIMAQVAVASPSGDNSTLCADIGGGTAALRNTVTHSLGGSLGAGGDLRIRQRFVSTVRLPGYGGANNDNAAVVTYMTGRNTLVNVPAATATNEVGVTPGAGGFVNTSGGAPCTQP